MTYDEHRLRFEAARLRAELDDLAERTVTLRWSRKRSLKLDAAIRRWDDAVDANRREGAA